MHPLEQPLAYRDSDYQQIALQCVRCAILLLADRQAFLLGAVELTEVLRWPQPIPHDSIPFLPPDPHDP